MINHTGSPIAIQFAYNLLMLIPLIALIAAAVDLFKNHKPACAMDYIVITIVIILLLSLICLIVGIFV